MDKPVSMGQERREKALKIASLTTNKIQLAEEFCEGWDYFLSKIDFSHTFLDAQAIAWMNNVGMKEGKIKKLQEELNEDS